MASTGNNSSLQENISIKEIYEKTLGTVVDEFEARDEQQQKDTCIEYLNKIEAMREYFVKVMYVAQLANKTDVKYDDLDELNADIQNLYETANTVIGTNDMNDLFYQISDETLKFLNNYAEDEQDDVFDSFTDEIVNIVLGPNGPSHLQILSSVIGPMNLEQFKKDYAQSVFMNYASFYPKYPNAAGTVNAVKGNTGSAQNPVAPLGTSNSAPAPPKLTIKIPNKKPVEGNGGNSPKPSTQEPSLPSMPSIGPKDKPDPDTVDGWVATESKSGKGWYWVKDGFRTFVHPDEIDDKDEDGKQLPPDWLSSESENQHGKIPAGTPYYFDKAGKTQWYSPNLGKLPDGWTFDWSKTKGKIYYVSPKPEQKSQFEFPTSGVSNAGATNGADSPREVANVIKNKSLTNLTVPPPPPADDDESTPKPENGKSEEILPQAPTLTDKQIAAGWEVKESTTTPGKYFYQNKRFRAKVLVSANADLNQTYLDETTRKGEEAETAKKQQEEAEQAAAAAAAAAETARAEATAAAEAARRNANAATAAAAEQADKTARQAAAAAAEAEAERTRLAAAAAQAATPATPNMSGLIQSMTPVTPSTESRFYSRFGEKPPTPAPAPAAAPAPAPAAGQSTTNYNALNRKIKAGIEESKRKEAEFRAKFPKTGGSRKRRKSTPRRRTAKK
jgi:hypothetical protein